MLKRLIFVAVLPLLASCASLSEDSCRVGDWSSIGYRDGANGQLVSYINQHREACADYGIEPDADVWARARAEGLKEYCTPANVYNLGRRGREMNPVCRENTQGLQLANFYGLRYYEISEEIDDLEDEIDDARRRLATEFTGTALTPEQIAMQQSLWSQIRKNQRDIRRLERDLRRYDDLP